MLHQTQDRVREKKFLQAQGIASAPFQEVASSTELAAGVAAIGTPAVLKTTSFGYDGKGQAKIATPSDAEDAWQSLNRQRVIYEGWVDYRQEFSVIVARSASGETAAFPPIANDHANHILDVSICPWPALESRAEQAKQIAEQIITSLDAVGVLCVEFFLTADDRILVNEIAPRSHNSGHLTIEACVTSQFEQQVRAICGLPLGSTELIAPGAMANLLGDLWQPAEPAWEEALADPRVHLHLYGKTEAIPGRKMGHLTVLAKTPEQAAEQVRTARECLTNRVFT